MYLFEKKSRKKPRKSVKKPPRKSRKSVKKPPRKSRKSVKKPPRKSRKSRKSVKKPPRKSSRKSSRKSVKKPPRKSRKSVKKPPRKSRKSVKKPPRKSRKSVKKPPRKSRKSVKKPPRKSVKPPQKVEPVKHVIRPSKKQVKYVPLPTPAVQGDYKKSYGREVNKYDWICNQESCVTKDGKFNCGDNLGAGGYGSVKECKSKNKNIVAVKELFDQDDIEIENLQKNKENNCKCDNVVCATVADGTDGRKRIVMEKIDKTFACGQVDLYKVFKDIIIGTQCLLNEKNLIYMDYNPKNIMIKNGKIMLVDIGASVDKNEKKMVPSSSMPIRIVNINDGYEHKLKDEEYFTIDYEQAVDKETHQGLNDLSYLNSLKAMVTFFIGLYLYCSEDGYNKDPITKKFFHLPILGWRLPVFISTMFIKTKDLKLFELFKEILDKKGPMGNISKGELDGYYDKLLKLL